ncbi:MAG: hypothetical protein EAZ27_03425 [Cytophagales bacterium]|nr:MAG: hypothetical protein EAZ27_03425 [Cytophagales bacterium]
MKLKTFAVIKDIIGDDIIIDKNLHTIGDLKYYLIEKYPKIISLIESSRFAVEMQIVNLDFNISEISTVYIIPPSSGG